MSLDYTPELRRQHEAYKAVRARLNRPPAAKVAAPLQSFRRFPPEIKAPVDKPVSAESLWRDWLSQQHKAHGNEPVWVEPSIVAICIEVRRQFKVEKMDFLSPRRSQKFVVPRQIAMAISKQMTRKSLPEIGRKMGNRDHTTIMHGCRKMQPLIDSVATKIPADASISDWVSAMMVELKLTPFARSKRSRACVEPAN